MLNLILKNANFLFIFYGNIDINSYESLRIVEIPYDKFQGLQTQNIRKTKAEVGEIGDRMF